MRTSNEPEALRNAFLENLCYAQGKFPGIATINDFYFALAYTVRDRLWERWVNSVRDWYNPDIKVRGVAYLSAEYLVGPHLENNLINLGILEDVRAAVDGADLEAVEPDGTVIEIDLEKLIAQEVEPGLGNGGLGRLAACYMDSLATVGVPAIGYGIRYEFGIFNQSIREGWQQESTDRWLRFGNPWEIARPEASYRVKLGGWTEHYTDDQGRYRVRWQPGQVVLGVAYDTPILGYHSPITNTLRLWKSEACESFDFQAFNQGDYFGAVNQKIVSENLTKVLYPNDENIVGKRLRLQQQYFFTSCSLQDLIRINQEIFLATHPDGAHSLDDFHERTAIQLNDTHPAIAVPELMHLLVDEHGMDWDPAWAITTQTFSYTNHTLLPEALETWGLDLFREVLPRHLEIIEEINRRFLDDMRLQYPGDLAKVQRMSVIDEEQGRVRMANLAVVGSHTVNGVAAMHSELVKEQLLHDFYALCPDKFLNVTNGVTPRRWLLLSNPGLAGLITAAIGDAWITDLDRLRGLEAYADDSEFQRAWRQVKRDNKVKLANIIERRSGILLDPMSMFDIQVKRIHQYKRQHLNVLHIITEYDRIKVNPDAEVTPRTFIFGGKAAPGYRIAKLIIKLINSVAEVVNRDPDVRGRLKVVFLPDFNVKHAHNIYPAADLSEQISTAGFEASGTGNMKFSMNGALTIGTLDGANVEIRDEVGAENFFLFGMDVDQVGAMRRRGYRPRDWYEGDAELRRALDMIADGFFSHGDRELFKPRVVLLLELDRFLLLADYRAYIDALA
jgi:starch phosphorylase